MYYCFKNWKFTKVIIFIIPVNEQIQIILLTNFI